MTRRNILIAASELFSRDGVNNTALENIAKEAGVTRGAIYWHFKDKFALLETLLNEQKLPLERSIPEGLDFERAWQLLHRSLVETVSGEASRKLSGIMVYQSAPAIGTPTVHKCLTQTKSRFMRQVERLLAGAANSGELAQNLDLDATGILIQCCISGVLYECLQKPGDHSGLISSAMESLFFLLKSPPLHLLKFSPPH